jgi:hypothetical protein
LASQAVVSFASGLGIALLATPVGWVIIIGLQLLLELWLLKVEIRLGKVSLNFCIIKAHL